MSCLYEVRAVCVQTWLISHAKTRWAVTSSILALWLRIIHRNVGKIIIFILTKNLPATDRYLLSYGPAKFDLAMASFEVKTRRAITLWILVRCRRFLNYNVANDVCYCWCNRGTMEKRREQTRRNIVAWRQISLSSVIIVVVVTSSFVLRRCVVCRGHPFWRWKK